jgi:hypothetical protein
MQIFLDINSVLQMTITFLLVVRKEKYHITKLHGPVLQVTIEKHGNWPDI